MTGTNDKKLLKSHKLYLVSIWFNDLLILNSKRQITEHKRAFGSNVVDRKSNFVSLETRFEGLFGLSVLSRLPIWGAFFNERGNAFGRVISQHIFDHDI